MRIKENVANVEELKILVGKEWCPLWDDICSLNEEQLACYAGIIANILLLTGFKDKKSVSLKLHEKFRFGLGLIDKRHLSQYPASDPVKDIYIERLSTCLNSSLFYSWAKVVLLTYFKNLNNRADICLWILLSSSYLHDFGVLKYFLSATSENLPAHMLIEYLICFEETQKEIAKFGEVMIRLADIAENPERFEEWEHALPFCRLFGNRYMLSLKLKKNSFSASFLIGYLMGIEKMHDYPISLPFASIKTSIFKHGKELSYHKKSQTDVKKFNSRFGGCCYVCGQRGHRAADCNENQQPGLNNQAILNRRQLRQPNLYFFLPSGQRLPPRNDKFYSLVESTKQA